MNADQLPVVCPACGESAAVHTGETVNAWHFRCQSCGSDFQLRNGESLHDKLLRRCADAGYQVADRGQDFTIVVDHVKTGGDVYPLQWAVHAGEAGPVRVRKLLDYGRWHAVKAPTVDGILAAIEGTEIADSRAAWPHMPEFQAVGITRKQVHP